jgi:hypothetical protein
MQPKTLDKPCRNGSTPRRNLKCIKYGIYIRLFLVWRSAVAVQNVSVLGTYPQSRNIFQIPEHTPMQSWNSFPAQILQHSRSGAKPVLGLISGRGTYSRSRIILDRPSVWEDNLGNGWSLFIPKAKKQHRKFEINILRKE